MHKLFNGIIITVTTFPDLTWIVQIRDLLCACPSVEQGWMAQFAVGDPYKLFLCSDLESKSGP